MDVLLHLIDLNFILFMPQLCFIFNKIKVLSYRNNYTGHSGIYKTKLTLYSGGIAQTVRNMVAVPVTDAQLKIRTIRHARDL